jgi:hypothetical protein
LNDPDGLEANPCWPKLLTPNDPGWALLTNDEYYLNKPKLKDEIKKYKGYPDLKLLQGALPQRDPSYEVLTLDIAGAQGKFRKGKPPPKTLQGVLPGIPVLPAPPRMIRDLWRFNDTATVEDMDDDESLFDSDDDEMSDYDDEEVDRWMTDYIELMRRQEEDASRTFPTETEAMPTPTGQGDATPVPAVQGSSATADVPVATAQSFTG